MAFNVALRTVSFTMTTSRVLETGCSLLLGPEGKITGAGLHVTHNGLLTRARSKL